MVSSNDYILNARKTHGWIEIVYVIKSQDVFLPYVKGDSDGAILTYFLGSNMRFDPLYF